jgi:hypothetical protein
MTEDDNIIIDSGGREPLREDRKEVIQKLADSLREFDSDVEVVYRDPEIDPSRRKVTWGEILEVYLGVKLVDITYAYFVEKQLDRVTEVIKNWARKTFNDKRGDKPNARPEIVNICEQGGKIIAVVKVNKDGDDYTETDEYQGRHRKP